MTSEPMTIRMVDTITQYAGIKAEVDEAFREILNSGAYINGPHVRQFKQNLAEYLGAEAVIPCANGTDALHVALMALDLKPGDEVIVPSFTWCSPAEMVAIMNLKPVFCEVDPVNFNMDPKGLESVITEKTKCIIPVHLYGQPAEMEGIMEVANRHNLFVIEDNAQSIGSDYSYSDGRKVKTGLIGHIGTTSFYPSKNLGAYGDAGAIFTNDAALADKIQLICNHGSRKRYYHEALGVNSRLDSFQAAVLDIKLRHLDAYNANRQAAASWYDAHFGEVEGLIIPQRTSYGTHVFHQYTLRITEGREKRDRIQGEMMAAGVPAMIYYPVPVHLQEAYAHFGGKVGDLPVTELLSEQVLSLPMHSELDKTQVDYIAGKFLEFYQA